MKKLDKQLETPTRAHRTIYLRNCYDIRRFLSRVINEVYRGSLDVKVSNSIAGLSNSLLKCLEIADVKKQLNEISEQLKEIEDRQQ